MGKTVFNQKHMSEDEPGGSQLPDFESCESIMALATEFEIIMDNPELLDKRSIDLILERVGVFLEENMDAIKKTRWRSFDENDESIYLSIAASLEVLATNFRYLKSFPPDLSTDLEDARSRFFSWKEEIKNIPVDSTSHEE